MEKARMFLIYFLFGSTLYGLIEIAYRNRTHWSMLILGGTALYAIYEFSNSFPKKSLAVKCLISAAFITMLELFTGILVNLIAIMSISPCFDLKFLCIILYPFCTLRLRLCYRNISQRANKYASSYCTLHNTRFCSGRNPAYT